MSDTVFKPSIFVVNAIQGSESATDKFEKFLEELVCVDDESSSVLNSPEKRRTPLQDYDSDEDDDALQEQLSGMNSRATRSPFFRRGGPKVVTEHETSYARFSSSTQFFQRASILSVSEKYGLPPSKDPEGTNNLAYALQAAYKRPRDRWVAIQEAATEYPVMGIVGTGWAEKHVHALPSVIVIVCTVTSVPAEQTIQDRKLFETIEHLQYSLVPKRQCTVQIVGLMEDGVSEAIGQEWSAAMALEQDHAVMALRDRDVRKLQKAVQEASLTYYLRQSRRTKEKLYALLDDKRRKGTPPPVQLSPSIVRYCFKIAVFYEFQQNLEKSVRFMSLAYRQLGIYYLWLQSEDSKSNQGSSPKSSGDTATTALEHASTDDSGGVELELADEEDWNVFEPMSDAVFQCRAVGDWLNTRLLTSGLSSRSEGGLLAASNQWRQHLRVFLSSPTAWHAWLFVAEQRCTWGRLVEAYPPMALSKAYDEVSIRCSPWRAYQAAAEATLRLGCELKATESVESMDMLSQNSDRPRYLGGLAADTLRLEYEAKKSQNHQENALRLILRSVELFEKEQQQKGLGFYAKDDLSERSSCRTGAHLFYLAGGILLGMNHFEESAAHLTKACQYARGWRHLELGIRRMLIECYENMEVTPADSGTSSGQALVSMVLDSYFNADMSSKDLRRALGHFSSMSGGGNTLKWHHETHEEEDLSLPFSFSLTFPGQTHATSGDTVAASVLIKSNLDYAVHLNSATLTTLAGNISIPMIDLMAASNASEGTGKGVIIQANTSIVVTTKIELPRDLSMIAFDESGNGGELQGVSGKGSFAKNAKPRTAGITSAAGARFVSETKLSQSNAKSQGWNLQSLGGKPLLCTGLNLLFYPVQAEQASGCAEEMTLIDLTIEKKKKRTAANIRRTAFEEENYLASAWSRPAHLPFKKGPRSLRVLGPQPDLVVTDLTNSLTDGQALEGTVNRTLLKLQAGSCETCVDIELTMSCFSVLLTPHGVTKRLLPEEELLSSDVENGLNMTDSRCRTPIMVEESPNIAEASGSGYGYNLPVGYKRSGSGQKCDVVRIPVLQSGQVHLVPLDLFRPSVFRQVPRVDGVNDEAIGDNSLCKTDFYVTIKYKQKRPETKSQKRNRRRSSRRRPVMPSATGGPQSAPETQNDDSSSEFYDEVELEHTGSVTWAVPLTALFTSSLKSSSPSGIRHPANSVHGAPVPNSDQEIVAVNQQTIPLHCSLAQDSSMAEVRTELVSVHFKDDAESSAPYSVTLCSAENDSVIFEADNNQKRPVLSQRTVFGVSCSLKPSLNGAAIDGEARSTLGSILVNWNPIPFQVDSVGESCQFKTLSHGPLALPTPSTIQFSGPLCYVERAPFEVCALDVNPPPTVGVPFDVAYRITNKTRLHQTIDIRLNGINETGLLLSGIVGGKLSISPFEQELVCFVFVSTSAGKFVLPSLRISSDRFDSWVVNSLPGDRRIFVFP